MARSQHLTGEMVQSVVSFYEEGDETINSAHACECKLVLLKITYNTYYITQYNTQ